MKKLETVDLSKPEKEEAIKRGKEYIEKLLKSIRESSGQQTGLTKELDKLGKAETELDKYLEQKRSQSNFIKIYDQYKLLLIIPNISFSHESIHNLSRSLLSQMVNDEIIKINFSCVETNQFLDDYRLGKDSASATLQYININRTKSNTDFFNIIIDRY